MENIVRHENDVENAGTLILKNTQVESKVNEVPLTQGISEFYHENFGKEKRVDLLIIIANLFECNS